MRASGTSQPSAAPRTTRKRGSPAAARQPAGRLEVERVGQFLELLDAGDHLVVEFRWGERNRRNRVGKARDSGIFLHATGPHGNSYDGDGAYMAAIECNVMEGAVGDFLLIKGKDARGRDIPIKVTATVADEKDADGWYTWRPDASRDAKRVTLDDGGRINWFGKDPKWRHATAPACASARPFAAAPA